MFFKRMVLWLGVNIAIVAVIMTIASVFGLQPYLTSQGLSLVSLAIWAALIGFAGSFISLLLSKKMAKWMLKVKVIREPKTQDERWLVQMVEQLASRAGIGTPEVGVYRSPEVNAFATGARRNHSLVAVSSGMLTSMNHDEIEGVLAHEISHVSNGDMITMTLLQGVMNTFVIFAARALGYVIASRIDSRGVERMTFWLVSIALEIVFGILASLVVMAYSRRREYRADAGSARLSGKMKMIAALKKLQQLQNGAVNDPRSASLATLKISTRSRRLKLWRSHPDLQKRIERLQQLSIA